MNQITELTIGDIVLEGRFYYRVTDEEVFNGHKYYKGVRVAKVTGKIVKGKTPMRLYSRTVVDLPYLNKLVEEQKILMSTLFKLIKGQ